MSKAFNLESTFVNLRADHSASALKVGPRFWSTIDKRTDLGDGRLMGCTPQTKDWPIWERHPAGEEILVLLSGELEMVVPRNTWHRALVKRPGNLMFITPGAGTEHRPVSR